MPELKPVISRSGRIRGARQCVPRSTLKSAARSPLVKCLLMPAVWDGCIAMAQPIKDMFSYRTRDGALDGRRRSAPWRWVIAAMDRNGLRPMRCAITEDGLGGWPDRSRHGAD